MVWTQRQVPGSAHRNRHGRPRRKSEEANKARSFWREPEFWLLLVAALASVFGIAWWVVLPLTVAGLSISSLPKYVELWPRARSVGADAEWWKTVVLSMLNNLSAACGAFVLGKLIHWLWW